MPHHQSETEGEGEGQRRAKTALVMMWIAIGALAVNVVGATTFWLALPEKLKNINDKVESQGVRLSAVEIQASSQASTMARVDERTKAIQDDVRQIHQDFSFRANSSPRQ